MFGPINSACKTNTISVLGATRQSTTKEEEFGRETIAPHPSFNKREVSCTT